MFQNMKVDVIYYKTNTDFEMEFNLCGCCRMRLLTDKVPDRKTTVYALARSVARSKIIITVGPLFGEEGVISTISTAIGSKLAVVDNDKFGIKSTSEIQIIDGSVPLVTSDGFFGGLIIERGNQTMILLTESKSVRKTVMQELIHPYIAEIYAEELKGNGETPHFSADVNEQEEIVAEEPVLEAPETEAEAEPEVEPAEKTVEVKNPIDIDVAVMPEVIPTGEAIGVAKIADIVGNTATAVLSDIPLDEKSETKSAVEAIEESLTVAQNDFIAENDPDSAFLLGDEEDDSQDAIPKDNEYLFIEDDIEGEIFGQEAKEDISLIGETEENTDTFNLGANIELVTDDDDDDSPIPMEIAELLVEQEELAELNPNDLDIPKGLVTDNEETQEEFHLPEEQRVLLQDIEPEEDLEPLKQHIWVEGEDKDFVMDDNVGERKLLRLNLPILIFSIILAVIILVICYFIFYIPMKTGNTPTDFIREIYETLFG